MRLWRSAKKKLKPVELYTSIKEMPQHNWEQMSINGDPLWLVVDQSERKRKITPEALEQAYFSVYDEYAEATGLSEVMDSWRDLMIMRLEARADVATGDRSALNRIDEYTIKIQNLMKSSGDTDVIRNRMLVQQAYGQPIKPKEITVYEYLMIVKLMEEQASRSTQRNDGTAD